MTSPRRHAHVVGLGLIGSSVALALREVGWQVTGSDLDAHVCQRAIERGVVDATTPAEHLDLVVIGGGVADAGPVLFDPLREALRDYAALDFIRGLQVLAAQLGSEAGLVGAAALLR